MRVLSGLGGAWLGQRSSTRQVAAWVLAVGGPTLLTLAVLVLGSLLVLGGFLFSMMLVVIAVAVIGGMWPALASVGLGVFTRVFFIAAPFANLGVDPRPNPVSLVGFTVVGAAVAILIGRLAQLAERQASSVRIEAALRRVATLVAHAAPADELFAAVTEEVGRLVAADYARMGRYDSDDRLISLAAWSSSGEHIAVGNRWPPAGELTTYISRTGRPARMDLADASGPLAADARGQGTRSAVGVPIIVEGRIWGVMLTGSTRMRPPPDVEARLASFTDLLATAISNADSRARITRLAEEQAALRRVATLVARGAPAQEVFAAVTEEASQLLQTDQTTMIRYGSDGTSTVVASWRRIGEAVPPIGAREGLGGNDLTTIISRTRRPARIDSYADAAGAPATAARAAGFRPAAGAPIIVQGRVWGAMIVCSVDDHPLPPDTEARLASFTELVATAISNAENLAELTGSRARVVAAADLTRRRIERDLHDGAQQQLVSLALALRAAQASVPPGLDDLSGTLTNVTQDLVRVMEDLREMARGIHPAILSEGGLAPALKMLARRSTVPVQITMYADARLPERVEVAAYYVVCEALTNAAKHAHASVIQVSAATTGQALHLDIRDDGTGGADPIQGSGLIGLSDRVEALGGTITIHSPVGTGTSLHAELPLAD